MNGLNGKPTEYPENTLVPYPVILAASKGDPDAMKIVLQHFSGYIARLSMRDIRERLQARLMRAICLFQP
ncbi:MAG: helix-turn-helix domain-containing protein [Clostridioides difficile]|nr:helix-turn-helix domain-containing protein [Clostridioides difficile]